MKLLRFKCENCGLQMALNERPEKCFCCGSTDIVREGWKQRHSKLTYHDKKKEELKI